MKFYKRDPARALEGMTELTLEQRGAYNVILDLLYARDGVLPDDEVFVAHVMRIRVQRWRRLKAELMTAGKIRLTRDGLIDANGVQSCRSLAVVSSQNASRAVTARWDQYRQSKQINGIAVRARNTSIAIASKNSSTSLEAVGNGTEPPAPSKPPAALTSTASLEASLRKKGWI